MLRQLFGIFCICAATAAAAAEPQRLSTQMLNETVPGSTIALDTPIGTKIPMRFGSDGIVTGEAGVLGAYLGAAKDRGRWSVADGKLCIKWFRWFDSEPRCMEISADGDRITWRQDDGDTGTGTLVERGSGVAAVKPAAAPKVATAKPVEQQVAAATNTFPDSSGAPRMQAGLAPPAEAAIPPEPETASAAPAPVVPQVQATAPPAAPIRTEAPKAAPVKPRPAVTATAAKPPVTKSAAQPRLPSAKTAAAKPPAVPTPSFRIARVEGNDMLNVRSGPSEESRAVGVISAGGRGVKIIGGCVEDWCPVRHAGVTGWVNRFYLAAE